MYESAVSIFCRQLLLIVVFLSLSGLQTYFCWTNMIQQDIKMVDFIKEWCKIGKWAKISANSHISLSFYKDPFWKV